MEQITFKMPEDEATGLATRGAVRGVNLDAQGNISINYQKQFLDKQGKIFKEGDWVTINSVQAMGGATTTETSETEELEAVGKQIGAILQKYLAKKAS